MFIGLKTLGWGWKIGDLGLVIALATLLLYLVGSVFRSRAGLILENLALRQQILVLQRRTKRPQFNPPDCLFWCWLSRMWNVYAIPTE